MESPSVNRRGSALLVVVGILLLAAGIIATLLSVTRWRTESARTQIASAEAEALAREAVERGLVSLDLSRAALPIGAVELLEDRLAPVGRGWLDSLERLDPELFRMRSRAELRRFDGSLMARAGVTAIVGPEPLPLRHDAAVLSDGPVEVNGAPGVDGADTIPDGWTCPPLIREGVGLRLGPAAGWADCPGDSCLQGSPALAQEAVSVAVPESVLAALSGRATLRIGGVVTGVGPVSGPGSTCEGTLNWGDPSDPNGACGHRFGLIWAESDTRIEGGFGQGVLLGAGRLELAGGFWFVGVVAAEGPVQIRDGAIVWGAVLSRAGVIVEGGSSVRRSECGAATALRWTGPLVPIGGHGWFRGS
jgi:hypothetical protein